MNTEEILTPDSERWEEFAERLQGEEGCDFKEKIPGDPESVTWICKDGKSRPFANKILSDMGGIDVEKTLEYFDNHGGHCDCEILFNVDR